MKSLEGAGLTAPALLPLNTTKGLEVSYEEYLPLAEGYLE